jgi:acyl-CoA dehydrogenase
MALDQETFALLKESVRRFVQERLVPNEDRVEHEDEVPAEIIAEMKQLGLFGISIPEEYGGIGLSMREEAEICFELGQTALAFRSVFGTNVGIGSQGILMDGTEAQRRTYLPKIASGEYIFSFALTEPGAGSDAASLTTSAVLDGDHYVINGTKCWISRGQVAKLFLVNVRFGADKGAEKGLLLVERDTPGFEIGKVEPLMGHRGSPSTELLFHDCRVPVTNRMSEGSFSSSIMSMSFSRCCNAAMGIGAAQRAFDEAVNYIQVREAFGKHLSDFQGLRWMIADMKVKLEAARLLIYRAAANASNGTPSDGEAAMAKTFANEASLQVISDAMQLFGANGYSCEYPLERLYRDARAFSIAGGTTQIQRNLIARKVLGKRSY